MCAVVLLKDELARDCMRWQQNVMVTDSLHQLSYCAFIS